MLKKNKKKTLIIVSILGGLLLLIGVFFLGRISAEKSPEPKNNLPPQKPEKPSDNPKPSPGDKKEERVLLSIDVEETKDFCMFSNWLNANTKEDIKVFRISKNHPRIKELLKEGKLQKDKWFTINYGKVDKKTDEGITYDFNEFNQDLEIKEV